jgi:membrane protease subunit HflC
MQAYRDALADDNTSFVLSPESEFFRFFDSSSPELPEAREARAPEGPSASWEDRRAGRQAQGEETAVATPAPAQPANAID